MAMSTHVEILFSLFKIRCYWKSTNTYETSISMKICAEIILHGPILLPENWAAVAEMVPGRRDTDEHNMTFIREV